MRILILFKSAILTITNHAVRSFLTILGIMIGIAAIIVTFSIGRGAEEKVRKQIMVMGEGACYILPGSILTRGAVRATLERPMRLYQGDLDAIEAQVPGIQEIARGSNIIETLEHGSVAIKERIIGTDDNLLKINKNKLKYGTFFTNGQLKERANVVVLGEKVMNKLFGEEYPIGKTIRIEKIPFVVIGVIDHQEHFWGGEDPNARSFIPFTVAKKYFRQTDETDDDLHAILIGFKEGVNDEEPIRMIRRILRFRHHLEDQEADDFTFLDQEALVGAAQQAATIIKLFGLIAACISLLVGGIGVMNIMLVSVQERKAEIGLRIAIGATKGIVQIQFLLESIGLCMMGGLIGILVGLLGQWAITSLTSLPSIFELMPLIVSFLVTIIVGVFFGFYPARKASSLNPIDALLER